MTCLVYPVPLRRPLTRSIRPPSDARMRQHRRLLREKRFLTVPVIGDAYSPLDFIGLVTLGIAYRNSTRSKDELRRRLDDGR